MEKNPKDECPAATETRRRTPPAFTDSEETETQECLKASRVNRSKRIKWRSSIDTASWITLRWVRGTRYYRVHLEQDLWSGWILTKVNGRRGSRLGRARTLTQPSIESALLGLAAIAKRRRERGYELMS
jgi:hypothetical protein